jgi:HK97 family phage prohead protease
MNEQLKATAHIATALVNKDEAKVPLILSEETNVIRWDWMNGKYNLKLLHGEDNIELQRAGILKLFYQHDTHGSVPPIGRLENVRLEDGKLKADAYFDKEDEFAMQIFGKIERGFLESVSVGVSILDGKMKEFKSKPNEYTATKWELNEVSIVNIPAIPTAGVGLSQQNNLEGDQMDLSAVTAEALSEARPDLVAAFEKVGFEKGKTEGLTAGKEEGVKLGKADGAKAEALRIKSIQALSIKGYESVIDEALASADMTADQVKIKLFDAQQAALTKTKEAHAKDGKSLADLGKEIGQGEGDKELSEEEQGEALMAKAAENVRGAK